MGPRTSSSAAKSGIDGRRKAALKEGSAVYTARRAEIIQVAANVFRELGYEAATLNDVATRLATDRASLYYYIGSKEEILHEIVRDVLARNLATADEIVNQRGSVVDKLQALIREMIVSFDENYPHMYVYIEDMSRISRQDGEWANDVLDKTKRFESIVVDLIERGRKTGALRRDISPELTALGLFGMINWTYRWYHPGSRHSPDDVVGTFTALFLDGARSDPAPDAVHTDVD